MENLVMAKPMEKIPRLASANLGGNHPKIPALHGHPSTPWTWFPVDFFPSKIHQSWELSMALAVAMVCEQNVNQLKFSTNTNT